MLFDVKLQPSVSQTVMKTIWSCSLHRPNRKSKSQLTGLNWADHLLWYSYLEELFSPYFCRLVVYPPPPAKRGLTITEEDLDCLEEGEFLNDVILDFYLRLKWLKYKVESTLVHWHCDDIHLVSGQVFGLRAAGQGGCHQVPCVQFFFLQAPHSGGS